MGMIPPLSCKQDLNILEFLEFFFGHNFYVHTILQIIYAKLILKTSEFAQLHKIIIRLRLEFALA